MRILLTGATGHLGRTLIASLTDAGHTVRALVRSAAAPPLDVPAVRGDLLDAESVARAANGCDATLHCGAVYSADPGRAEAMRDVAVRGTQHVLEAAARNGHERVLLASSMVTVGFGSRPETLRNEAAWNTQPVHPYFAAKIAQEKAANHHARRLGLDLVTLCPGGLLGPLDYRTTPTMAFLADLVEGRAPTVPGGVNYVDVRDVADAFVAALEHGTGRYLLTGECIGMRELGGLLRTLTGRRPKHLPLPRRALLALTRAVQPKRLAMAAESMDRWPAFDNGRARRELGFHPRPVEAVLVDALRWLARTGGVAPRVVESWEGRIDLQGDAFAPEEVRRVAV